VARSPRTSWERVQRGTLDIAFADLLKLAKAFGFQLDRIRGSHHILVHSHLPLMLNLQPKGRRAKRYQIRQLLAAVRDHGLRLDD
jgi:predicted RNA binding protein YcfA (HicA-like mRNA interferase family)